MTVESLTGMELDHVLLGEPLGEGGMGVVYRADDLALRRHVAVKVLLPSLLEDSRARQRFQAEISHAAAIEHPHIVPVYAAGYDKGLFFLVLRLIDGPDVFHELRRAGRFSEDRALRLVGQVASALWAVHRAGMVHRDVKPQNVLIGACGETDEHAVLTDFGIAKALDDTTALTGVGAIGTPAYMAPEVCCGLPATPQSDQYSLAVTAYEMLAGEHPFADYAGDVKQAHVEAEPKPLRTLAPDVSRPVAEAIHRGLAKDPERRFVEIRQLIDVDARSRDSFERASTLTQVLSSASDTDSAVSALTQETDFSDRSIASFTDTTAQGVARLRRRAARAALIGARQARTRRSEAPPRR